MRKEFNFAGTEPMVLNVTDHVIERIAERLRFAFAYNEVYMEFFTLILSDPRLEEILLEIPIGSNVALFSKDLNTYVFFVITANEVHIKTVLGRGKRAVSVELEDYKFYLPIDADEPLERMYVDNHIFVTKKRTDK